MAGRIDNSTGDNSTGDDAPDFAAAPAAALTRAVTRGVCRLFTDMNHACVTELTLRNGRRADVIALDDKGLFTIVEVKVSVADFRGDRKWVDYLPFCDRFYFAAPVDFPLDILPDEAGVIAADAYGAAILREAAPGTMNPARRKALMLRYARLAAHRLMREPTDPV